MNLMDSGCCLTVSVLRGSFCFRASATLWPHVLMIQMSQGFCSFFFVFAGLVSGTPHPPPLLPHENLINCSLLNSHSASLSFDKPSL